MIGVFSGVYAVMIVGFLAPLVGGWAMMFWMAKKGKQVEGEVRRVCEETTNLHSGISFHVREERYLTSNGRMVVSGVTNYIEGMSCGDLAVQLSHHARSLISAPSRSRLQLAYRTSQRARLLFLLRKDVAKLQALLSLLLQSQDSA